jgi:hypothetical protein
MAFDDYVKSVNDGIYTRVHGSTSSVLLSNGSVSPNQFGSDQIYWGKYTNTLTGKKNPNWRNQVRSVLSATTPCTGTIINYAIDSHPYAFAIERVYNTAWGAPANQSKTWTHQSFGFDYDVVDALVGGSPDGSLVTTSRNRAIQKLYSRLDSFASLAKTGEDLGEITQTLRAFKRPLPALRNLLTHTLSRGRQATKHGGVRGIAAALADTTLEWRWGWKPLCGSLAKSIVALQNREVMFNYRPFHATDFAVGQHFTDSGTNTMGHGAGIIDISWNVIRYQKHTTTYKGVWAEECQIPERSVRQCLGLQARDIVPTIWELIPYSCVIDYFANIGDIVHSLSVPWGGVKWCNYTIIREYIAKGYARPKIRPAPFPPFFRTVDSINCVPGLIHRREKSFTRAKLGSIPLPELVLTSPLSLTAGQYLNLAALATSSLLSLTKVVSRAVAKHPTLPARYLDELEKRGGNHPYPFHQK